MLPTLKPFLRTPRGLVVIGLLIREAFSFWTGHPFDFEIWLRNAYFVSRGGNPYSAFMPPVPGLSFAYLNDPLPGVGYLPLWPLILAALFQIYSLIPGGSRFVLYFLLKQPPILGDTLLGWFIYRGLLRWGAKPDAALRGLKFWTFFPYAIIVSAIWGMFDAIVVVLFMGFLLSDRTVKGYASLGLSIFLKWFPLIFLPFYALSERGRRKPLVSIAVVIPIALTALIFASLGWDYVGVTSMMQYTGHGGGGGMTYVNIFRAPVLEPIISAIPGFYYVAGSLWILGIVFAGFVSRSRFTANGPSATVQALLLITTIFFLTRWGVNEQYLIYLLPLFYIDVVLWHPNRTSLFLVTWVLSLAFLLVNNDLLVRFFGPLDSRAVDIAYAFDNASNLAPIRVWAMYALQVLFSVHLVQLARTFLNPARDTRPWLLWPFRNLRRLTSRSSTRFLGGE